MKKTAVAALVFALTLTTVWAQEDEVVRPKGERIVQKREDIQRSFEEKRDGMQEKISEKRIELQEKREELKVNREERQAERRIKLEERAKERVSKITDRVLARFEAFVVRYEGFADRIQSRIDKLEEKGVETSEMKDLLNKAEDSLSDTVAVIAASKDEIRDLVEGESSKEEIRAIVSEAKVSLKGTHAAFVEAVKSLKASDKDVEEKKEDDTASESSE
jgi:hypothetical protein